MNIEQKFRHAAKKTAEILAKGLPINWETLHFIESTFSVTSARDIRTILGNTGHDDREMLVNILLFPDEATQVLLEPFLENMTFTAKDIETLAETVISLSPRVRFVYPDNGEYLSFSPLVLEIHQFISRLNLSSQPDKRLLSVIVNMGDESRYFKTRVKLRNTRCFFCDEKIRWLCLFFDRIGPEQDGDLKLLDFTLSFLQEIPDGNDIYQALMRRKHTLTGAIDRYRRFLESIKNDNMETLMAKGIRLPGVDEDDAVDKITRIDDICIMIYGKTDPGPLPVLHEDLGSFRAASEINGIFKALS